MKTCHRPTLSRNLLTSAVAAALAQGFSPALLAQEAQDEDESATTASDTSTLDRVTVTRLASGLPVGADLEHADEVTLGKAFAGRRSLD